MKAVINSIYFFWALLALPSLPVFIALLGGADYERLLHPTGEFAARFLILSMMITPLMLIFKNSYAVRWLRVRRRAIGVAAFCYALLHTIVYLLDIVSLAKLMNDFWKAEILTGWVALAIFTALAITSNNTMVRKLRHLWKSLHRWVYLASILTLLHWLLVQDDLGPALVHFLPLMLLQAYRVSIYLWGKEPAPSN